MLIESRRISDLHPHPLNYRRHPPAQLAVLRESLRTHGFQKPVVVQPDGTILAGHGMVEAAEAEGQESAPCHVYDGPYPEAFLAMDNRSGDLAEDDDKALADLLKALAADEGLQGTGYGDEDLGALIAQLDAANPEPVKEEGAIPEPQEGPTRVQPGEVWQLGKHRVMCGDCSDAGDVDRLLAGVRLNLIVTSPPYAEQRKEQYGGVPADEYVDWFLPVAALWRERLAEDGSFFLNIKEHCEDGERHLYVKWLVIGLRGDGWKFVDELYWKRQGYPGDYHYRFKNAIEPVFHFARQTACKFRPGNVLQEYAQEYEAKQYGESHSGSGFHTGGVKPQADVGARPTNVIEVGQGASVQHTGAEQPAVFPVGLPTFFLKAYSDPGDTALDPFLGSGTTLIAAEQTERVAYGMEILPRYCDVVLARYEKFTGGKAVRVDA